MQWCLVVFRGPSIGPPLVQRGANLSDMAVCLIRLVFPVVHLISWVECKPPWDLLGRILFKVSRTVNGNWIAHAEKCVSVSCRKLTFRPTCDGNLFPCLYSFSHFLNIFTSEFPDVLPWNFLPSMFLINKYVQLYRSIFSIRDMFLMNKYVQLYRSIFSIGDMFLI